MRRAGFSHVAQLSDHLVRHRRPRGVLPDRDSPETFLAKHVVVMVAAKAPSDRKIANNSLLRLVLVVNAAELRRDGGVERALLLSSFFRYTRPICRLTARLPYSDIAPREPVVITKNGRERFAKRR